MAGYGISMFMKLILVFHPTILVATESFQTTRQTANFQFCFFKRAVLIKNALLNEHFSLYLLK
ncbi:hypothetical protein JCM15548_12927 [Geofilum rubicundum JCM 15548]|uniref:Uncharacterized protein n=1 Tax=Geofilum rubicundum JCM 15548 TaxID=1236989 RepID=A0A0E9M0H4_9BACT|nr:hypothetical protein JCM15548_12927 [Geofilum rubicundum JCM 15548]